VLLVLGNLVFIFGIDRCLSRNAEIQEGTRSSTPARAFVVLTSDLEGEIGGKRRDADDAEGGDRMREHLNDDERNEENTSDETRSPTPEMPPEWRRRDEAGEVEEDRDNEEELQRRVQSL
jgi:hypothetical protein